MHRCIAECMCVSLNFVTKDPCVHYLRCVCLLPTMNLPGPPSGRKYTPEGSITKGVLVGGTVAAAAPSVEEGAAEGGQCTVGGRSPHRHVLRGDKSVIKS